MFLMSWILLVDDLSSPVLYLNDAMYQEGSICLIDNILYSQKYWRSLNLAVWSQAAEIKILADLNLAVALRCVMRARLSGSVAFLLLEVLEQSREFANLQEI